MRRLCTRVCAQLLPWQLSVLWNRIGFIAVLPLRRGKPRANYWHSDLLQLWEQKTFVLNANVNVKSMRERMRMRMRTNPSPSVSTGDFVPIDAVRCADAQWRDKCRIPNNNTKIDVSVFRPSVRLVWWVCFWFCRRVCSEWKVNRKGARHKNNRRSNGTSRSNRCQSVSLPTSFPLHLCAQTYSESRQCRWRMMCSLIVSHRHRRCERKAEKKTKTRARMRS